MPVANATDVSAPVDVFQSLVAAMSGSEGAQPAPTDESEAPRHTSRKTADVDQIPAPENGDDDKSADDSGIAVMNAIVQAATPPVEAAKPRVALVKDNTLAPVDAKADVLSEAAHQARHAPQPERNAVSGPAALENVPTLIGDSRPNRVRHGADLVDLGHEAPAEAEVDTTHHAQASRRIEFARAVQAGIEITAPTPNDLNPIELALSARTAVPLFAAQTGATPPARPQTPAVVGAPTPTTKPAPIHIISPVRDVTMAAFRLSTPGVAAPSSPVDVIAPQIIQSMRVLFSRGGGEAHIRLDPRQFGDVSVSLRVEAGQVVARVQAEAPAVREWLQANQRTLQVGLAEHQLRLGRLEVVAPSDESRESTDSDGRRREESTDEPPARRHRRRESTGSFDVVA
jgi:flagellar hook-length control protein FliK